MMERAPRPIFVLHMDSVSAIFQDAREDLLLRLYADLRMQRML